MDGNGDWLTDYERTGPFTWVRRGQNLFQWRDPSFSWYIGASGVQSHEDEQIVAAGIKALTG